MSDDNPAPNVKDGQQGAGERQQPTHDELVRRYVAAARQSLTTASQMRSPTSPPPQSNQHQRQPPPAQTSGNFPAQHPQWPLSETEEARLPSSEQALAHQQDYRDVHRHPPTTAPQDPRVARWSSRYRNVMPIQGGNPREGYPSRQSQPPQQHNEGGYTNLPTARPQRPPQNVAYGPQKYRPAPNVASSRLNYSDYSQPQSYNARRAKHVGSLQAGPTPEDKSQPKSARSTSGNFRVPSSIYSSGPSSVYSTVPTSVYSPFGAQPIHEEPDPPLATSPDPSEGGSFDVVDNYIRDSALVPVSSQSQEHAREQSLTQAQGGSSNGLLRQASVGRSHKAVLTDISRTPSQSSRMNSDESLPKQSEIKSPVEEPIQERPETAHEDEANDTTNVVVSPPTPSNKNDRNPEPPAAPFQSGTGFVSNSDSTDSFRPSDTTGENTTAQPRLEADRRLSQESEVSPPSSDPGPFADAHATHEDHKAHVVHNVTADTPAVEEGASPKDVDERQSITSLQGLITRALRMASNLERGKTSSKFGTEWLGTTGGRGKRNSKSLNDNLNLFPNTSREGSPQAYSGQVPLSQWHQNSRLRQHQLLSSTATSEKRQMNKKRRQCCYMQLRWFILILVLIFLLIAAAVLVPVGLIVIKPRQASQTNTANILVDCQKSYLCANDGAHVLTASNECACVCSNGFTGPHCEQGSSDVCTTVDIGTTSNATVGNALPFLFRVGPSLFNVPLNPASIVKAFSAAGYHCDAENSLVTFNGLDERSVKAKRRVQQSRFTRSRLSPYVHLHVPRQTATSDGILYAASTVRRTAAVSVEDATSIRTTRSALSPTTSSSPVSTNSSTTEEALQFARVAVLYILQESQVLNQAESAQSSFQKYFWNPSSTANASSLALGFGWTSNLEVYTLQSSTGGVVGGLT